jgi:hypothetical protein
VTVLQHTSNKGHINTYNEGIAWASADYMLILSADDYLLPGALGRSVTLMNAHPEVGFTFGRVIELDDCRTIEQPISEPDVVDRAGERILSGPEFIELSASDNIVKTPSAVVRTTLQKRLGGYRSELPHTGDMEMWLRFAANASVGIVKEYQAVYRRHTENMSIAYTAWLPDLEQRNRALDCFFQHCKHTLPNAEELRRMMMWSLGCCAIGFASSAFNQGEMEVSEQLSQFALNVCPRVKRSWPWTKLRFKRRLGARAWSALRPALAKVRQPGRDHSDFSQAVYGRGNGFRAAVNGREYR